MKSFFVVNLCSNEPPFQTTTPVFLIYTSGTTGLLKGVVHRHAIRERLIESAKDVLQLQKNDFFWCAADPGWVTGLGYGTFAPRLLGMPIFVNLSLD
ncbi:MAG: AMP-binding protein [Pyrinomonadaceae bacterium]